MLSELWKRLEEEHQHCREHRAYEKNRTYHLCMEDRKLSAFTQLWMQRHKPCPFSMRDAAEGVHRCVVVSIADRDGQMLDFITEALAVTEARLAVSKIVQPKQIQTK